MREDSPVKNSSTSDEYLMESEDENIRLDIKTDPQALRRQALWCGVKPGMRVLDAGCGPGITTKLIDEMIQPKGAVVGLDYSPRRIEYADKHYKNDESIEFHLHDLRNPIENFGKFDLIWVRFVLEYHRNGAQQIVKNLISCLKAGGHLCLLDLDYNCLIHHELPEAMASILPKIMNFMDEKYNFDAFMGRKLYSLLYDNGFEKIDVELMAHNLIFGEIKDKDRFNWNKKVEMGARKAEELLNSYPGGYQQFSSDLNKFLIDPRRFTYTPLLLCKGEKRLL